MNEQELRALVRAAVSRHLQPDAGNEAKGQWANEAMTLPHSKASHVLYTGLVNVSDDCLIEPAVKCDHCGYCKSQGF
jgi:hypothetical protein